MILLWGLLEDASTRSVFDWLTSRGADLFFLNHAAVHRTAACLTSGRDLSWQVECDQRSCRLEHVSAAYLRPFDFRHYKPALPVESNPAMVHHLISAWAESTDSLVIGRPSGEGTNQSKLFQAAAIHACGFLTPESLITNSPGQIREFQSRHGRVIYKSMSNVRSIVKELEPADLERENLGPVLFQQRVAGQNVRVHVVGERCFACAVETEGLDYRYAPSKLAPVELPSAVAQKAIIVAQRLGLAIAGLDLIHTPEDDWYCLEANPNPAFSCFDESGEIAQAVGRLLLTGPSCRSGAPG